MKDAKAKPVRSEKEIAAMLGRPRQTISDWTITRIADSGKASKPKRKPKVTEKIAAKDRPKVVEALDAGKTQQEAAADHFRLDSY